jgi:CheY-like chemotaxis protein
MTTRILVVDDEPALLRAYVRSFTLMGYSVLSAPNGSEALDMFINAIEPGEGLEREGGGLVDLVVTDYEMPVMKGDDLCRQIKKRRNVPVILLSGKAVVHAVARACGADESHLKPVRTTDLQVSIERLTRKQ